MDPSQQANVTQPLPPAYPGPPDYGANQTGVAYPQQPGFQGQPGTTTIIHTQPTHIVMGMRFFENPTAMTCPYCQATIVTATTYVSGTLTWIACGGVALMGGWLGCCLIPFCIDACKDVIHSCPNCSRQVGVYRRV
ncbi:lipopolysaccharide-induced tumor necrosis factor-alpha factor homolog [Stylophora pistillata]|nr:lipopolysaccharide-induced tumor necrosis factor-alpha factor homolog [Stylophora pistillata]